MTTLTVKPRNAADNQSRIFSIASLETPPRLGTAKTRGSRKGSMLSNTTSRVHERALIDSLSMADKIKHIALQAAVVALPLLIVLCLSVLALVQAREAKTNVDLQLELINDAVAIAKVLNTLEHEQDAACDYAIMPAFVVPMLIQTPDANFVLSKIRKTNPTGDRSGDRTSMALDERLRQAILLTDQQVEHGRAQLEKQHRVVLELVMSKLIESRAEIRNADGMSCARAMELYDAVVHPLVMKWVHHLTKSRKGKLCQLLTAFQSVTSAKLKLTNMNAFGIGYFSREHNLTTADLSRFHELRGCMNGLMDNSLDVVNGPILPQHHKSTADTHFHWMMTMQRDIPNATAGWERMRPVLIYQNLSSVPASEQQQYSSAKWADLFAQMKQLMDDIALRGHDMLDSMLAAAVNSDVRQKNTLIVVIVLTTSICPTVAVLYAWFVRRQRQSIVDAAETVKQQSKQIMAEQAKANQLLNTMLPVSVAEALRAGKVVSPESYQSVSVLFADVIGFSHLVNSCTPNHTVEILNNLYSGIDEILEIHSCYKVEIVNDCVVISSGVPYRNGNRHSNELASTALDILMQVSNQELPHIAGEHLLLRLGIHTGPCTTGVIGVNKPKFCLFGDVVNTSSRMMSSSEPMCIHVTEDTHAHLQSTQPNVYTFEARGTRTIKGKGEMMTYWLLGKEGHEYIVDRKAAATTHENATYFRRKMGRNGTIGV